MVKCQYCSNNCKRDGKQKDGTQKYRCKACGKYQQEIYRYQAKLAFKRKLITRLVVRNTGFSGIASALEISVNTVKKVIHEEAEKCHASAMPANGIYEIDEIKAYAKKGKPEIYAAYALERQTKNVIGIQVGKRNKRLLRETINTVMKMQPKRIYTDALPLYRFLIPQSLHKVSRYMLAHIERLHLTARNALKMLNRKTLAFVRNPSTLLACLKLLFWS